MHNEKIIYFLFSVQRCDRNVLLQTNIFSEEMNGVTCDSHPEGLLISPI